MLVLQPCDIRCRYYMFHFDHWSPQSASSEEQPLNADGVVVEAATEVDLKPVGGSVAAGRRGISRNRERSYTAEDSDNTEVNLALMLVIYLPVYVCVRINTRTHAHANTLPNHTAYYSTYSISHSLKHLLIEILNGTIFYFCTLASPLPFALT